MEKGKATQPLSTDEERDIIGKIQSASSAEKLQSVKEGFELDGRTLADHDLETLFNTRMEGFTKKTETATETIAADGTKAAETAAALAGDEGKKGAEKITEQAKEEVAKVQVKVTLILAEQKGKGFTVLNKEGDDYIWKDEHGQVQWTKDKDVVTSKMQELAKAQAEKETSEEKSAVDKIDLEKLKQEIGGKQKILANLQEEYDILKDAEKGANDNITPQLQDLKLRMTDLEKEITEGKAKYEAATGTTKDTTASKERPTTDKKESITSKESSISKEEFQNFVDKNIISEEIIKSIAEKIKGNKQLSPEEQSVLAHRGEDIESILKGEAKKEQKVSPTAIIDGQIAVLEKQLAEKSANEKAGDAADIQELDYQIRQLKKEREAILANPEKHEGQLDDSSDALKNHLAGGKSNVVETGTKHAEADAEKVRLAKEQHEKIKNDLDSARADYQKLYKEFQSKRSIFKKAWQGLKGGTVDFNDVPEMAEAMKAAQSKYQEALAGYGNDLYQTQKETFEKHGLAGKDLEQALAVYKAKDIFDTVVLKEKEMMAQEKTAILPEKVKGVLGKTLGWYTKLPKGVRMVLSTAIATGILVGTGHVAASGALAYGGYRLGRAAVSGLAGQLAVGTKNLFWNANKDIAKIDKKFEQNKNELGAIEGFDMKALQQMQVALEQRLKQEKNARIKHLVVDGAIRLAVGYGAGKLTDKVWGDMHPPIDTPPKTETPPITETGPNADAIINKGEGIEHALIRQIEHNPSLAEKLGFQGGDLHKFAQMEAHRIAMGNDYVEGAQERWVNWNEGHQTAYQLEVDSNGQPVVREFFDGTERDTMSQMNDQFIKTDYADSHKYEYLHNRPSPVVNPDNNGVVIPKPEVKVEIPMEDPNGDTIPMEDPNEAPTLHDKVDIEPITPKTQGVEITPSNNIDKVVFNDGTIHTTSMYNNDAEYANSVGQGQGTYAGDDIHNKIINNRMVINDGSVPTTSMYHNTKDYANSIGQGQMQDKYFNLGNWNWNSIHNNPEGYVSDVLTRYNPQGGTNMAEYIHDNFPNREAYGDWTEYFQKEYQLSHKVAKKLAKSTMTNLRDIADDGHLNHSLPGQIVKQGIKNTFGQAASNTVNSIKGLFGGVGTDADNSGGWNGNTGTNYNNNVQGNGIQMGNGITGTGNSGTGGNYTAVNQNIKEPKSTWFGGRG